MIKLFLTLIGILMPFVAVWFLLGAGAKLIGYAPTITGGMKLIGDKAAAWWGVGEPALAVWYPVDECQLNELTEELKQFFAILILEFAQQSIDLLYIRYYQTGCTIDSVAIDAIFRKYLRKTFNLPAGYPLYTWVYLTSTKLHLLCAFTENGRKWIEQQRNNERSREIQDTIGSGRGLEE